METKQTVGGGQRGKDFVFRKHAAEMARQKTRQNPNSPQVSVLHKSETLFFFVRNA